MRREIYHPTQITIDIFNNGLGQVFNGESCKLSCSSNLDSSYRLATQKEVDAFLGGLVKNNEKSD